MTRFKKTSKPEIIVKYDKKVGVMICKCGGKCWCDGEMKYRMPLGFGFHPGNTKFAVDFVEYKGHVGECEECRNRVFAWVLRRRVTRHPAKINNSIRKGAQ